MANPAIAADFLEPLNILVQLPAQRPFHRIILVEDRGNPGDQRLHGYSGDTGAVVYGGGGANELMTGVHRFNTGIAARGRIYFAADNKVYAFILPLDPTCDRACGQRPRVRLAASRRGRRRDVDPRPVLTEYD